MRRIRIILAAAALMVSVMAVPAHPITLAIAPSECMGQPTTLRGTDGDNVLVGTSGNDVIAGGEGADKIWGLGGDDVICGNQGNDELVLGVGDDRFNAGSSGDMVHGGGGNDGRQIDGNCTTGGSGDDFIDLDSGDDGATGVGSCYEVDGGQGDDVIFGNDGNDYIGENFNDGVADELWDGDGRDEVVGSPTEHTHWYPCADGYNDIDRDVHDHGQTPADCNDPIYPPPAP